jgi:hypothetical protein
VCSQSYVVFAKAPQLAICPNTSRISQRFPRRRTMTRETPLLSGTPLSLRIW